MNNTGTVGKRYIVIAGDIVTFLSELCDIIARAFEQRLIFFIFEILAPEGLKNLICLYSVLRKRSQNLIKKRLRHIIGIAVGSFNLTVFAFGIHTECDV